jgi:hypothetical protein
MTQQRSNAHFRAKLLRPADSADVASWVFVVLPKAASEILPRRGRVTVEGTLNGHSFQATLDPDGRLSHWLKISTDLQAMAGVKAGERVSIEITPVKEEPEPDIPHDLQMALESSAEAHRVWCATTTLARLDWIHWIVTAKQAKTRAKRVNDACEMLASGKKRVCCFDPSGYYSKALSAPEAIS